MNENTLHLSISGLKDHEAAVITQHVPVRHGVSVSMTDLALVDDEPDTEDTDDRSHATVWVDVVPSEESLAAFRKTVADLQQGTIAEQVETLKARLEEVAALAAAGVDKATDAHEAAQAYDTMSERGINDVAAKLQALRDELHLADPAMFPNASTLRHVNRPRLTEVKQAHGTVDDGIFTKGAVIDRGMIISGQIDTRELVSGSISAADSITQHAPEQPPVYPEGRTLGYLAALARDSRKGGRVLVIGRTLERATNVHRALVQRPEVVTDITSATLTRGRVETRLRSGITVRPLSAAAARGMSADLVIIAVPEDEYTATIARHVEPCVAATHGRVFTITEEADDA